MILIPEYQTWNHHFWRRMLSELLVLLLARISWIIVYNDCYFAPLFLSSLPLVAAFLLFPLHVVKSKYEWEKFIRNVASPAVPRRESLWLLFPPMGSLWMTMWALRETVPLADHMQSLGNRAQNVPRVMLLDQQRPGSDSHSIPERWGITAFIPQALSCLGFWWTQRSCAFLLLISLCPKDSRGSHTWRDQVTLLVSLLNTWLGISCSNIPMELKHWKKKLIIQYLISCFETAATTLALPPFTASWFLSFFSTHEEI